MENKTGKYFKYAIGEIVLVVIGILIALSINNWNEERKSIKKSKILLTQVHKELAFNINKTNVVINDYRRRNSRVYKVLNKKVTYNDYKINRSFSGILLGAQAVDITDDAYKNFINYEGGDLTLQQDSIVSKLKHIYGTLKKEVDVMDLKVLENLFKFDEKLKDTKTWYYDYSIHRKNNDYMVDYFLNDPIYLNEVTSYYRFSLGSHNFATLQYRNSAIKLYDKLSDYLSIKKDTSIIKNLNDYEHYLGNYVSENGKLKTQIIKQNENLVWSWKIVDDTTKFGKIDLYPDTKTYFTFSNNAFGELIYNKNKKVTGFIRSFGKDRQEFKKVN